MGFSSSNLSAAAYGYSFVVATTQESINASMQQYMNGIKAPEIMMCYIMDQNGNPQSIDYQTLITQANGTDPFSVPDGTPVTDPRIQNLSKAYFMYAFKAQIGLPAGYAPLTPGGPALPNIVVLGSSTATVQFNLTCSEFQVTEATYGPRGIANWLNQSQPAGQAWIFSSLVDMQLTPNSDYANLPPAVQAQIKNLGGNAFSVQQLLFDLDNAALQSTPTITGVVPGTPLYNGLQSAFLGPYMTQLKTNGQPVLGYSIQQSTTPPASITLTDLNFEVNPYMGTNGQPVSSPTTDQQGLSSLCYLCAANGVQLPVANEFSWNWIDPSEESSYNGVVAINRNTFANFFETQLYPTVSKCCFSPLVRVWLSGTFDTTVNYQWGLSGNQTPTVNMPSTGSTVATFTYSGNASDQAGLNGDMGSMTLTPSMNATVVFTGKTIVITQHLVIYVEITGTFGVTLSGNVVDITYTDTYTLGVDASGSLTATLNSVKTDNSVDPSTNGWSNFWGSDVNSLMNDIATWVQDFAATNFTDIPLNTVQSFVFPGGNTFTFDDVSFSENRDLVSHITYVQV
ncbi:hypothetical protein [Pedobacter sp. AJM]|uniref:hypothetical protein n=1 Tax=Pedobacter sp. AJM TaxID=2003629 RepID=UPI000B4A5942|nr:hypothetical protein [Pedobacter sp. AJM]OWK70682.1 hypothetical protein CBW18_06150 [Pedobacter sp. AJM]